MLHTMTTLPDSRGAATLWPAILAAARIARDAPPPTAARYAVDAHGLRRTDGSDAALDWTPERGWSVHMSGADPLHGLFALYLPFCAPRNGRPVVIGHLGQSLDGFIATPSGDSRYVTGEANLEHLHRLRALADAVVVGAVTVAADDPQLTTRRVSGTHPLRVVIDPRRRLSAHCRVFTDGQAETLVVCAQAARDADHIGQAQVVGVPARDGVLDRAAIVRLLAERGCASILVEGGGVTVSGFLEAGLLDRLHLAIAPLIIGNGRRGLQLPAADALERCARPAHQVYRMGEDVLFDCDPRG